MKETCENTVSSRHARFLETLSREAQGKTFHTPERLAAQAASQREEAEVISDLEALFERLFDGED